MLQSWTATIISRVHRPTSDGSSATAGMSDSGTLSTVGITLASTSATAGIGIQGGHQGKVLADSIKK